MPGQAVVFGGLKGGPNLWQAIRVVGKDFPERLVEGLEAHFTLLKGGENRGNFRHSRNVAEG